MKRVLVPLVIFLSIGLIALSGWLGYESVNWSTSIQLPIPLAAATPTTSAPARTVAVTRGDVRQVLTVPGEVAVAHQQQLGFSGGGTLVEMNVRAGDSCTKGQTLARLDAEPLKLALSQAQVDLDAKQAALDKLNAGPTTSDLTAANAAVKDAQTSLQNAQYSLTVTQNSATVSQSVRDREYEASFYEVNYGESLQKYAAGKIDKNRLDMDYSNLITAKERLETARVQAALTMNQANQQVANAQETLRKAQDALTTLKAGSAAVDLKQAQTAVEASKLALQQAQVALDGVILVAPLSGKVLSVAAQNGDTVTANATVVTLADLTQLEISTSVGQEDVANVQAGQPASVTFDAKPGETFTGQVNRVVPTKASTSGAVTYNAFVALDKAPAGLLPGMTADADITVAERKGVLVLQRRSIRARANATIQLSVVENGRTVSRNVRIGLVGDQNVEILSGLQEGDQVVAAQ